MHLHLNYMQLLSENITFGLQLNVFLNYITIYLLFKKTLLFHKDTPNIWIFFKCILV